MFIQLFEFDFPTEGSQIISNFFISRCIQLPVPRAQHCFLTNPSLAKFHFQKLMENNHHSVKLLLIRFHLNAHTKRFHPELRTK